MAFQLIQEDTLYKEEVTYSDAYTQRGVYYPSAEAVTYESFTGTYEPYQQGEESLLLPSGASSSDARLLYSDTPLLTYDDAEDASIADKVFLSNPESGKKMPQRYVVMNREDWSTNGGFQLIGADEAVCYLLVKEGKVLDGA